MVEELLYSFSLVLLVNIYYFTIILLLFAIGFTTVSVFLWV